MKKTFKKLTSCLLVMLMLFGAAPFNMTAYAEDGVWDGSVASGFASGTGTEENPYIIETAPQLAYFAAKGETQYKEEYIRLANDIVLNAPDVFAFDDEGIITGKAEGKSPNVWTPIGGDYKPISISSETEFDDAHFNYRELYYYNGSEYTRAFIYNSSYSTYYYLAMFSGSFDGGGHTVSGIFIDTLYDYQGLFGYVFEGSISNISVAGSYIKGGSYIGGVAGYCYYPGTISGSNNSASVTGEYYVGGVVGYTERGSITGSGNSGRVTGTGDCVGGIAGQSVNSTISCSSNAGSLTGVGSVGGVAGQNEGSTIINCFNAGKATGSSLTGGVAGYSKKGVISNSYSAGVVTGSSSAGGVIGIDEGKTTGCFYLSGTASGGVNGSDTAAAKALTDAEMRNKDNFEGWDFHNLWAIDNNNGYEYPQFIKQLDKSLGGASAIWDGTAADGFAGGTGTKEEPYLIETAGQLKYFADTVNGGKRYCNKFLRLTRDIRLNDDDAKYWTLNAAPWTAIGEYRYKAITITSEAEFLEVQEEDYLYYYDGSSYHPTYFYKPEYSKYYRLTLFSGTFDGGGHTVSGIYIDTARSYQGLFGYVSTGKIYNLNIAHSFINGDNNIGGIAGCVEAFNYTGSVSNCQSSGCVMGSGYVGGIAGQITNNTYGGTINNCRNTGTVTGGLYIGGVAGYNYSSNIVGSSNSGEVTGTGCVGGVVGYNNSVVTNSCNTGVVTGLSAVGGVVGCNDNVILNSCNAGVVTGVTGIGGITGSNDGTVGSCYNYGGVTGTGDGVSGLVGFNYDFIRNSYNAGSVTGAGDYVGGVAGFSAAYSDLIVNSYYLSGTASGGIDGSDIDGWTKALTDAEMKDTDSFGDWDFHNVWTIDSRNGYEYPQFILNLDKKLGGASAIWDGTAADGFARGTGESDDPYIIETAGQLAFLAKSVNVRNTYKGKYFELANDIRLNDYNAKYWILNARKWTPIGPDIVLTCFEGTFDGCGHTVSGVYIDTAEINQGLFGVNCGVIKNIEVTDSYIKGGGGTGGIAGRNYYGTIINSTNNASVTGIGGVGGIVGVSWYSTVSDSRNRGDVKGSSSAAGITVNDSDSTVTNSFNTGSIMSHRSAGGVAVGGTITNCFNTGSVIGCYSVGGVGSGSAISCCYNTGSVTGIRNVGGVSSGGGNVSNCYNTGSVTGEEDIGGVVGSNSKTVSNCYSAGKVTGKSKRGGVAGSNSKTISYCYYLSGTAYGGIGGGDYAGKAQPLTEAKMKLISSFSGWDFTDIWTMDGNTEYLYPELNGMRHGGAAVTSVSILDDDFELQVGDEYKLTAGFLPSDAANQSVTWSSDNDTLATVSPDGVVKAVAVGTVKITVTTAEGGLTDDCFVTVVPHEHLYSSEITVAPTCTQEGVMTYTCRCGYSYTEAIPAAGHSWGEWITVKEATYTESGLKSRECSVCHTVETEIIPILEPNFTVEAIPDQPYTGESITPELSVKSGGVTLLRDVDYTVEFIDNRDIGTAAVKVTGKGNYGGMRTVTFEIVAVPVCSISLNKQAVTVNYDSYLKLKVNFNPIYATNKTVTWKSSDKRVAEVNEYGLVTAKGKGTAVITAVSCDGGYTASCTVTVKFAWWQLLIRFLFFGWIWY